MRKNLGFEERIALMSKRNGLKVMWQQLKYGFKRVAFDCDSYEGDLLTTVYDTGDDQPKCNYRHQAGLEEGEDGQ